MSKKSKQKKQAPRKTVQQTSPIMWPPEAQAEHLTQHWNEYAGLAYEGFLEGGRGALMVRYDLAQDKVQAGFIPEPLAIETWGAWLNPDLAKAVATYDPEFEVVAFFIPWEGSTRIHYHLRGINAESGRTPKQLYAKRPKYAPTKSV